MIHDENTKNLLVTDFLDAGDGDNVMIFTNKPHTEKTITEALTKNGATFTEVIDVPEKDLQYYIYEPCYLND